MASTKIQRTLGQNANSGKLTISVWVKKAGLGEQGICGSWYSGVFHGILYFSSSDQLVFYDYRNGYIMRKVTTAQFRDVGAWMHIVCNFDHTLSSPTGKIYVNGVEQTLSTDVNYTQGSASSWLTDYPFNIGTYDGGSNYFNGNMSDFYFIQGQVYSPSTFGETDATTGIWKPKTEVTVDYSSTGNNSCHLKFENSANMDLDSGDNNVSFTTTGNLTQTIDTPSNNFATLNPLDNAVLTLSEGNTKATHSDSGGGEENRATLGAANGKWYFEFQIQHTVGSLNPFAVGMMSNTGRNPLESDLKSTEAFTSAWHTDSSVNRIESRVSGSSTLLNCNLSYPDNGDIVNVAMDLDNGRVFFGKNGTYINDASGDTGNPSTGANPPVSFTTGGHFYFPAIHNRGSQGLTVSLNTGQPSFSISSGNADANGYGNFEYAVPSGYYALCTKNLAEFG